MKRTMSLLLVALSAVGTYAALQSAPDQNLGLRVLGLFGGICAAVSLTQLLLGAVGRWGGLRALSYSLGLGARLFDVPLGRRRLVVRTRPYPLLYGIHLRVPAPRGRVWAVVAAAYAVPVLLGGWLLAAGPDGWRLFGTALTGAPVLELLASAAVPGGAGWIVLRLPTAPEELLAALCQTPVEAEAKLALENGRIDEAAALLDGAGEPSGPAGAALRIHLLLARGHWQQALADTERLPWAPPPGTEWVRALLRGQVLVCAADAGLLSPAEYLPRLTAELDAVGPRQHAVLLRADLLRLRGEREAALKASAVGVRMMGDALVSADALCSRAAALLALGRTAEADRELAKARKLLPGLARIALVERRAAAVVLD
ncbi:hypothetical protein [Kitasatospora sp. NPDC057198]|uniref:hypothetical protein n=1 Tax=Kitasatospora sp. NPDC057198 TaxID=3346046 RepID=UPI00362AA526